MNRRSLLLGGVVASVAGILGVKARPVEVAAIPASTEIRTPWVDGRDTAVKVEKTVTFVESWDNEKTEYSITLDELRNTPEYKALLIKRVMENLGVDVSGYGVMQEMSPPYRRDPSGAVYPVDEADYARLWYGPNNPYSIPTNDT